MRIVLSFLLAVAGLAQVQPVLVDGVRTANLPAQMIGINDLVAVSVYRSPELSRAVRVGADGAIALPLLTGRVRAAGLMPSELADEIARELRVGGLLVNPIVEVTVAEYASRPISVIGAVNNPLTFQAVGRVTLLDALARAGGLAPEAAQEILVSVPGTAIGEGRYMVRRIPVKGLIAEARQELNLVLTGGEEIRVAEAGKIFVVGNVAKPGSYAVHDPSEASVMRMIALAEGLTSYHRKVAYIYREEPDTGFKHEIEVELARILKREVDDVPLQVKDVLYIPDNPGKRTRSKVLDRSVAFGAATVSGLLIWGR